MEDRDSLDNWMEWKDYVAGFRKRQVAYQEGQGGIVGSGVRRGIATHYDQPTYIEHSPIPLSAATIRTTPFEYETTEEQYGVSSQYALPKMSNHGNLFWTPKYTYELNEDWIGVSLRIGDIINTPKGKGILCLIEDGLYCVELNDEPDVLYEFSLEEVKRDEQK